MSGKRTLLDGVRLVALLLFGIALLAKIEARLPLNNLLRMESTCPIFALPPLLLSPEGVVDSALSPWIEFVSRHPRERSPSTLP